MRGLLSDVSAGGLSNSEVTPKVNSIHETTSPMEAPISSSSAAMFERWLKIPPRLPRFLLRRFAIPDALGTFLPRPKGDPNRKTLPRSGCGAALK